jgi:hypothetical protein
MESGKWQTVRLPDVTTNLSQVGAGVCLLLVSSLLLAETGGGTVGLPAVLAATAACGAVAAAVRTASTRVA